MRAFLTLLSLEERARRTHVREVTIRSHDFRQGAAGHGFPRIQAMKDPVRQGRRFLRAAGVSAWILSGAPAVLMVLGLLELDGDRFTLPAGKFSLWLGAAAVYGAAFWLSSEVAGRERPPRVASYLLMAQSVAALAMFGLVCTGLETTLLVVVAVQLGLFVRLPVGLLWVALQTALLGGLGIGHWGLSRSLFWAGIIGFPMEVLAMFTSYFAASQARARHELARANAELKATQEIVAESRQMAERARISRELHDLLGHHLTALSLNLEAARHQAEGSLREVIERCQSLTKLLLGDVRDALRSLRGETAVDLQRVLGPLVADIPRPRIHLEVPDELALEDPERAQAVVRCVQEIVTNAVRHSHAENLWLEVSQRQGRLQVLGRDDGRGAREIRPGQGLSGMRERLESLGGSLETESPAEGGFHIRALIPLPVSAHREATFM